MGRHRKILEVYKDEELVCKGFGDEIAKFLGLGTKSMWRYLHQGSLVHKMYRLVYVGDAKPPKKQTEEPFDYMLWHLKRDRNTIISSRDISNIGRLEEALGQQIRATKILNNNGTIKKGRPSYHYLLEVDNG